MTRVRLAITTALLALALGACADILGLEVLVETPPIDAGTEAAAVPDAGAPDR